MAPSIAVAAATWRAIRRAMLWWSISLAAIVAVTVAFWPAFRGASGISQAIETLPGPIVEALGLENFGTPAGFLRGNLYELLVPLLFAIAAVALVSGQTASDEASGRLELFLAQPVDRRNVFVARLVACLAGLAVIVVVTATVQIATDAWADLTIDAGYVIGTAALCGLLAAVYGSLAYLVACLRPSPPLVLGVGLGLTLTGYFIAALFPISDVLEPWKVISVWEWAFGGNPLEHGAEPWRVALLAGVSVVFALVGTLVVSRRDIAAA